MFGKMDEMQVAINKIDQLKMVHIYEVAGTDAAGTDKGCTAMAVYYGTAGKMNLNDTDPHFAHFVRRVMEVYRDSDQKEWISMDEPTRAFMEAGLSVRREEELRKYYEATPLETPVCAKDSVLCKRFLPLAEYLIIGLNKVLDISLKVLERKEGWRGNGSLVVTDGLKERRICVQVRQPEENRYQISAADFLADHTGLTVDLRMESRGLSLTFASTDTLFNGRGWYRFEVTGMTQQFEAFYREKPVFFDREDEETCGSLSDSEKVLLGKEIEDAIVYELPWSMKYVFSQNLEKCGEIELLSCKGSFLQENYLKQYSWKELYNANSFIRIRMETIGLSKTVVGRKVQTYFEDVAEGHTGEYEDKLAGCYFLTDLVEEYLEEK